MENIISVSVLSSDVSRLADVCSQLDKSGADWLHFDVMDGVFVDNISFGVPLLEAVNRCTDMFLDVHLMIVNPLKYIDSFVNAGADMITFHYESDSNPLETIRKIKSRGIKAGIAIKPATPPEKIFPLISEVDMVLVMTVEPGFGGQGFMHETLGKIKAVRDFISADGLSVHVQVDGGINDKTAVLVKDAGADILVSGSYLFKSDDMKKAVGLLKN